MSSKAKTPPNRQELDALISKIRAKVVQAPEKAAIVLKDWSQKPAPAAGKSSAAKAPPSPTTIRKKAG
jgi:hypothetical protein